MNVKITTLPGAGTLALNSNASSYFGTTTVNAGILLLNDSGGVAVPAALTIGDFVGGTFLFAPRYLDRDGLSLHYVDEGAGARVLLLKTLRLRGVSEFSGYRKFTVDTSTTYTNPRQ